MAYMDFVLQKQEEGRKTEKWKVISAMGSHELGIVSFHPAWRKYVFWPEKSTIFDPACLRELADFVEGQTALWKTKRKPDGGTHFDAAVDRVIARVDKHLGSV